MAKLILTVRQRLLLENYVRAQRVEDDMNALELLIDIRKKVGFSDDERLQFVIPFPDGTFQLKPKLPDLPTEIEFEQAEIRKLASIVKSVKLTPDDAELWYFDLRKQLITAGVWK